MTPLLAWDSETSTYVCLLIAGINGLCHRAWLSLASSCGPWDCARACACMASLPLAALGLCLQVLFVFFGQSLTVSLRLALNSLGSLELGIVKPSG